MTQTVPPKRTRIVLLTALSAAVLSAGVSALLVNIYEHKREAKNPFFRVVEITDDTEDPAVWGKNFPQQYDGYRRTVDMVRTHYGGSEAMPRTPTQADPRSVVAQSKLEQDPRLKVMWSGYAFAVDFREDRGHAYMLDDQTYTERQHATKQPGTCINCHASTYVAMKRLGGGDLVKGFDLLNQKPYAEARKEVTHPVSCLDCHEPSSMQLRITRPAFMEGIKKVKALEGIKDYDVNTMASRQEMRAYVCGQCHVEYFFKGPEKRLTYPWDKGLAADKILDFYEEIAFKDWVHKETGAPVLKAQHPEFELWSQGTHARAGVACADCHMPYTRVGAQKVSDHHVRSPLLNVNAACQTCHHVDDGELRGRVERIQNRHYEMRNHAMDALMDLIGAIREARDTGASDTELAKPRNLQRRAQFLLDFAEAENSTGFHAPQEGARILALSLDYARLGTAAMGDLWRAKAGMAPFKSQYAGGPPPGLDVAPVPPAPTVK
jgi:nitrite reductase (cytochrome c-552)